jgi:hypothetical protein
VKRAAPVLLVALLAALAAVPAAGSADDSRLLVAVVFDRAGEQRDLRVLDASGRDRGRLRLPESIDYRAAGAPGRVVYVTDDGVYIVDAARRSLTRVHLPASPHLDLSGNYRGGRRYAVLSTPGQAHPYLLDTSTGRATSLDRIEKMLVAGLFSPDERYVVAIGRDTHLVPTARSSAAVTLPRQLLARGFSPDGRSLVLVGTKPDRIVVRPVAGGRTRTFRPRVAGPLTATFVTAGSVLVLGAREAALLSPRNGSVRRLGSLPGSGTSAIVDPGGRGALVQVGFPPEARYVWADLVHGGVRPLPALSHLVVLPGGARDRGVFLIDNPEPGSEGRRLAAVDLATGSARIVLTVPRGDDYSTTFVAPGGGHAAAVVEKGKTTTAWLVPSGPRGRARGRDGAARHSGLLAGRPHARGGRDREAGSAAGDAPRLRGRGIAPLSSGRPGLRARLGRLATPRLRAPGPQRARASPPASRR